MKRGGALVDPGESVEYENPDGPHLRCGRLGLRRFQRLVEANDLPLGALDLPGQTEAIDDVAGNGGTGSSRPGVNPVVVVPRDFEDSPAKPEKLPEDTFSRRYQPLLSTRFVAPIEASDACDFA